MQRRELDFRSGQEVILDIEHLRTSGYEQLGQWNLTQICEHLSATMKGGMDGFGFRLPWILRATLMKWAFQYFLKKRRLRPGAPTFRMLKPKHQATEDDPALIEACVALCRRADDFAGPIEDYPLLDNVDVNDWREFMWIHASHHLSFLVPKDS